MSPGVTTYFAYGSNLGASVLRTRCPRARQVGIASIVGYRIGFPRKSVYRGGGVADLVPAPGSLVWGALFDLGYDGFDALDEYEGVPDAYNREVQVFRRPDGSTVSAWVYLVVAKGIETSPSRRYWRIIVDGAKEAGLPDDYVKILEAIRYAP
jgi:gamma-glutamylcyclotransferase